jgi:hypothetical protein
MHHSEDSVPYDILNTISSNYVEDTLEPFKSRKSSIKQPLSTQKINSKKINKWDLERFKLISRNKPSKNKKSK